MSRRTHLAARRASGRQTAGSSKAWECEPIRVRCPSPTGSGHLSTHAHAIAVKGVSHRLEGGRNLASTPPQFAVIVGTCSIPRLLISCRNRLDTVVKLG